MDFLQACADQRRRDSERAAASHRLRRECRRSAPRRPSRLLLRFYARVWWASRPRAAAWTPGLLDDPVVR